MRKILDQLAQLDEAPRVRNDDEYPTAQSLAHVSAQALKRSYSLVGTTASGVSVFEKNNGFGFLGGMLSGQKNFVHFLDIKTRRKSYPSVPANLSSDYHQVSWVHVVTEYAESGYTRDAYELIATHFDLVSDHEQYLAAKQLWRSVARIGRVNVYVWDGNIGDYVRNENGIVRYNSENINEKFIWGDTIAHENRLLVATTKHLTTKSI